MTEEGGIRQRADDNHTHAFVRQVVSAYITNRHDQVDFSTIKDWDRVGLTVAVHGLEGIFYYTLKDTDVPAPLLDGWQRKSMAVLFDNLRSLRTAVQLFSMLDAAGIPAAAMRGLALAHKDYLTPGMRDMGDIDILISPNSRQKFLEVINQHGISLDRVLRSQYVLHIDGTKFEIHWSFLTAKRYRDIFDSDLLLASRQPFNTQDGTIYCLSNEHELIGLITHAFIHHELMVVKQLLDIGLYMVKPEMDWGFIQQWSRSARLNRMFSLACHLVSWFFMLDVEDFHKAFSASPSPRVQKTLNTYFKHYFGGKTIFSHLGMKRNLLYVAEPPLVWLKQMIGFFTLDEVREAWQQLASDIRRLAAPTNYQKIVTKEAGPGNDNKV